MRNFTLIFQFFIKDQTVKFQYIFVLVRDLNTGFTSVRKNIMYIQQVISQKYATKGGGEGGRGGVGGTKHNVSKFRYWKTKKVVEKSVLQTFGNQLFLMPLV